MGILWDRVREVGILWDRAREVGIVWDRVKGRKNLACNEIGREKWNIMG